MLKEDINFCLLSTESHKNVHYKKPKNDEYEEPIYEIPDEIKIYLSKEFLTNDANKITAIDELFDFFSENSCVIPRKSLKWIISILDQKNSTDDSEFIEKVLTLVSIILNISPKLELTSKEISIIRQHFPNQSAILLLSKIIQLHPPSSIQIVESFKPSSNYIQFNEEISMLLYNETDNRIPILELIYQISNKFEIASYLDKIFKSLIEISPILNFDEKNILFKILKRLCLTDKKYFQRLYNNDNALNLYKNVCIENQIVKPAFKFLSVISDCDHGYENPVDLFNRMAISTSVIDALQTRDNETVKYIAIAFSNSVQCSDDVDYFLENEYLRYLLALFSEVSFETWEEIVKFVCYLIYYSDEFEQIDFLIKNYNGMNHIAKICETVESSNEILCQAINLALQHLYEYAENQLNQGIKVFSQEMREMLSESAEFEDDDDIHFLTDFIQKIDKLYDIS